MIPGEQEEGEYLNTVATLALGPFCSDGSGLHIYRCPARPRMPPNKLLIPTCLPIGQYSQQAGLLGR